MKILVINCHSDNRGDEAAIHGLVDELNKCFDELDITIAIRGAGTRYPNMPGNVKMIHQFMPISRKANFAHQLAMFSSGKVVISNGEKILIKEMKTADIILHAPGGPSIGDIYFDDEPTYLKIYDLIRILHKPYMFYAPSMGPFNRIVRNRWRKKILNGAEAIVLRDPISAEHVRKLLPGKIIYQTLDSAFQHDIDVETNKAKLDSYTDLKHFLSTHEKCVGITITDLLWHPLYSKNKITVQNIHYSFKAYLQKLIEAGYGIVFIPQLYGNGNDYNLMRSFATDSKNFFIIPDNDERYDTYFQQFLISQLFAVIGMRYHSNIFSAKMGTPFISISYEQKMLGFMEKMELSQYCIRIENLSAQTLEEKFELLIANYDQYKVYLNKKHRDMKDDAYQTTEIVKGLLERIKKDKKDK